ncbi:ABC transporter substrate-binding protein [Hahella ganghwensis]|uniref:ABC transporter substrate-binding protein n=1 Tax=Hahella ganghwensis TaxID=286420 RepID=UPI0003827AB5|nr:ABC transporter substrate-binding protein [Hahella ganghwensis]
MHHINRHNKFTLLTVVLTLCLASAGLRAASQTEGVYRDRIVIGGVLDLEGQSRGLGIGMRDGIQAAFAEERIQGKQLEYVALNDSYTPELTAQQTQKLINEGVFAMVGNVGTPTAKVALPLLASHDVPAIGFFTGAGILRPGTGEVINFRASYVQETAKVIEQSLLAGLSPSQICAFVQNDAYGMAGVEGIKLALNSKAGTSAIIARLDQILAMPGENPARNGVGPVGVYQRNTLASRPGYESLKKWEQQENVQCRLVVTVGTYNAIGRFAAYARQKGDDWMISAVSFTGADNLLAVLSQYGVNDKVIVTQVVPDLDSDLPIVHQARKALGERLNVVSLEGYIVGKMTMELLKRIDGEITRNAFRRATRNSLIEVGGLRLDFRGDNQGSDLVIMTYLNNKTYQTIGDNQIAQLF